MTITLAHTKFLTVPTNKKGEGWRWTRRGSKGGDYVRIDRGDPRAQYAWQQVDHVRVNAGGKALGRDGRPIAGGVKGSGKDSHIPLDEWLKWSRWDRR